MERRKQIAFDLDTKMLRIYYPKDNWRQAYEDIKSNMLKAGFHWQQGSVYVSKSRISRYEVSFIIKDMVENNQWLNVCMRDCRVTNIGREHSQNHLFDKSANIPTREELKKQEEEKEMESLLEGLDISMSKEELEDFMRNEIEGSLNFYDLERG